MDRQAWLGLRAVTLLAGGIDDCIGLASQCLLVISAPCGV